MTIHYAENTEVIAGLQPDSRRDRGDRIELVDQFLDIVRQIDLTENEINDLQGYYWKTISRKTAFHGISGKLFTMNNNGLQLLITWSQDCQYPLQLFLFDEGYIVGAIYTFKQTKASHRAINSLTVEDLREAIKDSILKYAKNYRLIRKALSATEDSGKLSKHFRYFRNTCLQVVESFNK
jgi:hypothetical protein